MRNFRDILREVHNGILAIRQHRYPRIRTDDIEEAERLVKQLEKAASDSQTDSPRQAASTPSTREDIRKLISQCENIKTRVEGEDRISLENLIRKLNELL